MQILQVSGRDVVARDDGLLELNDVVDTSVRVEVGLDLVEEDDRSVGASTTKLALLHQLLGEADGIVERQLQ